MFIAKFMQFFKPKLLKSALNISCIDDSREFFFSFPGLCSSREKSYANNLKNTLGSCDKCQNAQNETFKPY